MDLRLQVFVNEQKVPLELELEDDESQFLHIACLQNNQTVATTRIGFNMKTMTAHIGRVAVSQKFRKQGLGRTIMEYAHQLIKICQYSKVELGAQLYAQKFYQKLGYTPYGDNYLDANIPHINMQKLL